MAASDRDILPDSLKPIHYDISLYDLKFQGDYEYKGTVNIDVEIRKPTKQVVVNAHQIKISSARVTLGSKDITSTKISHDEDRQIATIDIDEELSGGQASITLDFTAYMNNLMCGFSRAKYVSAGTPPNYVPKEGDKHLMFSTQFEACDCRRALPCFDEPNLKATFDFEIEIPTGLTALSNMPLKGSRAGRTEGRTAFSFERTPIMSTYLLAFAFGDFEYIEAFTERKYGGKQIPVRVYTTRGLKAQGEWGLKHSHKIVDYYSEIFEIDYPLPKIDVLAVHEFAQGAMENWGLITYRTTAILFEEGKSDERWRERIAYVVAHELAHQWFGNLVTMDWWNELWLNEGFATWVGWLATDHMHPDWDYWSRFLTESMQTAMRLDSLRASHPIEVPVRSAIEADQVFDAISYRKGSSMIRMLSEYLGVKAFLKGIATYLKKHAYGNAKTEDLWSALSEASGQDVEAFMNTWIKKIGFPVLTITEELSPNGLDIHIKQSRFLTTEVKPEEDETVWWVPLGLKNGALSDLTALTAKQDTVRGVSTGLYKLNKDATGFYITNYPPERLTKLGTSLQQLSINDRISLIADAAMCAKSGIGSVAGLLSLLEAYRDETHTYVWQQILSTLGGLRGIFSDPKTEQALKRFTLKLISPIVEKIGWQPASGETYLQGGLRPSLLISAGNAGHEATVAEGLKRFQTYISTGEETFKPTLRIAVLRIGVQQDEESGYEALKEKYTQVNDAATREALVSGMGRIKSPALIEDFLTWAYSGGIATQDLHGPTVQLSSNRAARPIMWKWIKENWTVIEGRLGGTTVAFDRFIRSSLGSFVTKEERDDVKAFFEDKNTTAYARALVTVLDGVEANYLWKERDEVKVAEWLQANGYMTR